MVDNLKFALALNRAALGFEYNKGIGTYSEKMLHRSLKFYFEPDEVYHEIEYCGAVADIKSDDGIIEIQTRAFENLIPKLSKFLVNDRVTVVYPIIENRVISRYDPETGEANTPRKSRKKGRCSDALAEIAKIREFIPNEKLRILVVMLDATETRLLKGKNKIGRKRTDKINCIPIALNRIISFESASDYAKLLPQELGERFTAVEFERVCGIKHIGSHGALMLLLKLGLLERERSGRAAYVYTKKYIQ